MLLVGNLNTRLAQPRNQREEELSTATTNHDLEDQTKKFIPWQCYRGEEGWTWNMRREGRTITDREDYILGSYHRDFCNISTREPRVSTYHWIVLVELRGYKEKWNHMHHRGENDVPLQP